MLIADSDAGIRVSVTSDIHRVDTRKTRQITFRATLRTDAVPGKYRVELRVPRFGPQDGAYIYPADRVAVEGTGEVDARHPVLGLPVCPHGREIATQRIDLTLPANSTTILKARYDRALDLPWPRPDYRLTVAALPLTAEGDRATHRAAVIARSPRVLVEGPVGVRIGTTVVPDPFKDRHGLRLGQTVRIRGDTHPVLRHRQLLLRYRRGTAVRTAAVIRTDGAGRFGPIRWRPRRAGDYQHWIQYRSSAGAHIRSDRSCPLPLRVRR